MEKIKRIRMGIIGYGGLGRAMVKLLHKKRRDLYEQDGLDLVLTCILGRNGGICAPDGDGINCAELVRLNESVRGRAIKLEDLSGYDASFNFKQMLDNGLVDLVAEFTPTDKTTGEPGLTHIRECLSHGVHVTTGNKGPILIAWDELSALAREKNLLLGISCTTGGALPTLINGIDTMAGSTVLSIEGILNGTTNFILDRMEHNGESYGTALRAAQAVGIAESNPTQDVEGWDTAIKLLIIARAAMRAKIALADVRVEGITRVTPEDIQRARNDGARIKLIGRVLRDGDKVICEVAPTIVSADNPLYSICGKDKAVRYVSDTMGELFVSGGASGLISAAAASLRDVINAHRSGML